MKTFSRPKQFKINLSSAKENLAIFTSLPGGGNGHHFQIFGRQNQVVSNDRLFLVFAILWFVPLLATIIFAAIKFSSLPFQIPLYYSRLWGTAQLAPTRDIFWPTGGTFIIGVFNIFLAGKFWAKDKVVSYLLLATAALISLLAAITTFNIVSLVT